MNKEVTNYIENSAENQMEILKKLRSLILSTVANANEQFKWSRPVYGLEKDFCYIKTNKKYVTLGFFEFERIKTNSNLIEGTGKSMRHIKISKVSELTEFQLDQMIKEVIE